MASNKRVLLLVEKMVVDATPSLSRKWMGTMDIENTYAFAYYTGKLLLCPDLKIETLYCLLFFSIVYIN